MENSEVLSIDVEKVIKSKTKNGKIKVPSCLIRWLKRIIHQDEINYFLLKNKDAKGVDFSDSILRDFCVSYQAHGDEDLDPGKRYIFVSNHPLGGLDGMVLISHIGHKFKDIRFVVNDLLMHLKPLESLFIPINKYGSMKQNYAQKINEAFESDVQILYFPAGLCSRLIKGKISDLEWKKTFVKKAIEYKRDIVPIYFSGRNSMFFYRLAKVRKMLGIKFNIETLFLPDEMFKQKNAKFDVYFGEVIPHESLSQTHSIKEWTEIIRNECYKLKPSE